MSGAIGAAGEFLNGAWNRSWNVGSSLASGAAKGLRTATSWGVDTAQKVANFAKPFFNSGINIIKQNPYLIGAAVVLGAAAYITVNQGLYNRFMG